MSYKETEAYVAHQKLGFPKIEDVVQFEMLITHNHQPIMDVCPEIKTFPFGLLNEYITVSKSQLKDYLIETNFVKQQLDSFSSTYDGFWLQKTGERYVFFERERGCDFNHVYLENLDKVLNHFMDHLGTWCR